MTRNSRKLCSWWNRLTAISPLVFLWDEEPDFQARNDCNTALNLGRNQKNDLSCAREPSIDDDDDDDVDVDVDGDVDGFSGENHLRWTFMERGFIAKQQRPGLWWFLGRNAPLQFCNY